MIVQPKISVIIPNYNHSAFLVERIESVLNQSYDNFEVIILDDCSKDNSREIIEKYRTHPKISHIVFNQVNSGSTFQQWNRGIDLCESEIIWIAESDDVAEPNFLEEVMKPLSNENIVLSYSQSNKIDSEGMITGSWRDQTITHLTNFDEDFIFDGKKFIYNDLIHRNVIPNASAVLFKKSAFYKVGKADVDIKYNSDWLLWLKILTIGDVAFIKAPLNKFRYHSSSVIMTSKDKENVIFERRFDIIMFERFISLITDKNMIRKFKTKLSYFSKLEYKFLFQNNLKKESKQFLLKGFKYDRYKVVYICRNYKGFIRLLCFQL
ncbi:glycosyltransferase [Elizabethkingia anophelis]|uniref:glycosyltransferase n=1 Tax=Elizabethkingia anophelis TaxID=1117645 RepID=UPI00293C4000|nr:glycosyl transferase [Elizabethkingia anophelis]